MHEMAVNDSKHKTAKSRGCNLRKTVVPLRTDFGKEGFNFVNILVLYLLTLDESNIIDII